MDDLEEKWREIKKHPRHYMEIEKPDSNASFRLMEDFLAEIEDAHFRSRLSETLNKPKPFRHFKNIVDQNEVFRQKWFAFKNQRMIAWVKKQLENHNDFGGAKEAN